MRPAEAAVKPRPAPNGKQIPPQTAFCRVRRTVHAAVATTKMSTPPILRCSPVGLRFRSHRDPSWTFRTPDIRSTDIVLPVKPLAVVFDMDGLLFDTEALYRDAMIRTAAELGHDMPVSLYLDTIGLSAEATRLLLRSRFGDAFDLARFWERASGQFAMMAATELRLKPGVVDLLDLLDGMGLPFAIATSSQHHDVQRNLDGHGLRARFPTVVAYGDYDNGKPHPARS